MEDYTSPWKLTKQEAINTAKKADPDYRLINSLTDSCFSAVDAASKSGRYEARITVDRNYFSTKQAKEAIKPLEDAGFKLNFEEVNDAGFQKLLIQW